jgi:SAM-dependent methyltransferase
MKLSRKILKFTEPLTYRRGWRRAQRSIFRVAAEANACSRSTWTSAREIQQRYANSTAGYAKYAEIEPWLKLNRERVQDLNLHRSAPKRVLDLGCGGGFFLFILKNLGHSVMGLDIDRVPLFGELLELFGVRRSFTRSTLSSRCRTSVNNSIGSRRSLRTFTFIIQPKKRWGTAEWDFFLRDLQHHLAPGGKIFFGLNPVLQRRLLHS